MLLWPIGVALELVSTVSGTLGKQLIVFSEMQKRANRLRASGLILSVGLFVNTVVGPVVDLAAYAFAPQSLIAPFGGLDVVWNTLLAPCTLGEKLTPSRLLGVLFITGGTLGSAFAAENNNDRVYTTKYVMDTLLRWRSVIYLLSFLVWLLFNFLCLLRMPLGSVARGFSLGATAGSIAGNMFCVKAVAELIKFSIVEMTYAPWTQWITYAVLAGAVFFAGSNVAFMTKGLLEYEALFMIPVYEGSMVVSNALSAIVVMGEMDSVPISKSCAYFGCITVIVGGLWVLVAAEGKYAVMMDDHRPTEAVADVVPAGTIIGAMVDSEMAQSETAV